MTGSGPRRANRSVTGGGDVWLAIETATSVGSVALWNDGLVFEQTLRIHGTHSEVLLPAIEHALAVGSVEAASVGAFVVGSGPGSFTGVRIGGSLAKGWAAARGIPLFAYPSLLGVAAGVGYHGPLCVMFDARRGEVYAACYEISPEDAIEHLAPAAWQVPDLLNELAERGVQPAFVGEGAIAYREVITSNWDHANVLPELLGIPRAASLLWLRQRMPDLGHVARPQEWEPLYVRDWRVQTDSRKG